MGVRKQIPTNKQTNPNFVIGGKKTLEELPIPSSRLTFHPSNSFSSKQTKILPAPQQFRFEEHRQYKMIIKVKNVSIFFILTFKAHFREVLWQLHSNFESAVPLEMFLNSLLFPKPCLTKLGGNCFFFLFLWGGHLKFPRYVQSESWHLQRVMLK